MTLKADIGPEDFGIRTEDAENAYNYAEWYASRQVNWLPIETAPKGVNVLCYTGDGFRYPMVCECIFDDGEWWPNVWETNGCVNPTHWMPLPAAPEEEAK